MIILCEYCSTLFWSPFLTTTSTAAATSSKALQDASNKKWGAKSIRLKDESPACRDTATCQRRPARGPSHETTLLLGRRKEHPVHLTTTMLLTKCKRCSIFLLLRFQEKQTSKQACAANYICCNAKKSLFAKKGLFVVITQQVEKFSTWWMYVVPIAMPLKNLITAHSSSGELWSAVQPCILFLS